MEKDDKIFLEHILDSIKAIESFTVGIQENDFYKNQEKIYAVIRCLEIIGEAAKNLTDDFRAKYPVIPWKKIAGTRDNLIHEYFGVDNAEVWKTVKDDIPELKKEIGLLLNKK